MSKTAVFQNSKEFFRDNPQRCGPEFVFGEEWISGLEPGFFRVCWLQQTQEFYLKNTISFKTYLMPDKAKTAWEAKARMNGWEKKMAKNTKIEEIFPGLALLIPKKPSVAKS